MKTQTTFSDFLERLRQLPKNAVVISFELEYEDGNGMIRPETDQRYTIGELYGTIKELKNDSGISSFELRFFDRHGYESRVKF